MACVCCRFWRVLSGGVEDADSYAMHGKEEDEERHVYSKRQTGANNNSGKDKNPQRRHEVMSVMEGPRRVTLKSQQKQQ